MKEKKFYKLINNDGWVLSNKYEKSAENVLGYGGVWTKDHRKAKRFASITQCELEVAKMPYKKGTKFLVVSNNENWKQAYANAKKKGKL